jgi:hypothetical protein
MPVLSDVLLLARFLSRSVTALGGPRFRIKPFTIREGRWHPRVWSFVTRPRAPRGWGKHGTAATREEDAVLGAGNGIHVHVYECVCAMYVCVYVCMYVCVYVDVWLSDTGMQPVVYFSRDCVCDIRFMMAFSLGRIRSPW